MSKKEACVKVLFVKLFLRDQHNIIGTVRHSLLLWMIGIAICFVMHESRAAVWPDKPIKMVVPFSPGGSTDLIARLIADKLSRQLKQPVVVENKAGAGGLIGSTYVSNQPADGYTLLLQSEPFITAPLIATANGTRAYDPDKNFSPIASIATSSHVIVVSPSLKIDNLQDLLKLARERPGQLSYGSAGPGTMNHLGMELFSSRVKIEMMHVPYSGFSNAINGILGDQVQILVGTVSSLEQFIKSGKVKPIAVTGLQRSSILPDVPTVAEAGVSGFELKSWWGLLGPAGMPENVISRLNKEVNVANASKEMDSYFKQIGAQAQFATAGDFSKTIKSDTPRWSRLLKDVGIIKK